ncbi:hypothetical protein HY792_05730 [Candidatus Desantisbacteria bacterium]|nr:hypothetical protein [Candidatus Desantisbacteria bacterium]
MGVLGKPILTETEGPRANVAVLYHGFPMEASSIVGDSCWLSPEVELETMKRYPALIIPSGGFFGLETSEILKYKFREYVNDGGVLVCFAQQQGYEFSCLPGTISAYGWNEDQSCWQNAAYIDTDHPIFASQEDATLDAGIDGYFTQWPNDATILLRRTKNQMPAMLMYKYGSGTVIASTLYSDFSSGHNMASKEEIKLINDLISYVEGINKPIPEYQSEDTIQIPVTITYDEFLKLFQETPQNAGQVEFTLRDSNKKPVETITLPLTPSLAPGQSTQIIFQTTCPQDKLGIFWINYTLKDTSGNILKPETKGERFYVSKHLTGKGHVEGLYYWVTSPAQTLIEGADITFTLHIKNETGQDKNLTIKWDWTHGAKNLLGTYSIKADETKDIPLTVNNVYGKHNNIWRLWVWVYEGLTCIGNTSIGGEVIKPEVDLNIITDKKIYDKGDRGTITLVLQDKYNLSYNPEVRLKITDPFGDEVFATNTILNISPNGSVTTTISFPIFNVIGGVYLIEVEVYNNKSKIGMGIDSFEIPAPEISTNLLFPETFIPNSINPISFLLTNIGFVTVPSGSLTIEFKEPNGNLVFGSMREVLGSDLECRMYLTNVE